MEYVFKYRRFLFWKKIAVVGHSLSSDTDRMDLYFRDGRVYSIPCWSKYYLKLGSDWVACVKDNMENETGQNVKLNVR